MQPKLHERERIIERRVWEGKIQERDALIEREWRREGSRQTEGVSKETESGSDGRTESTRRRDDGKGESNSKRENPQIYIKFLLLLNVIYSYFLHQQTTTIWSF